MRRILLATALVAVVAAGATTLAASSSDGSNGKKTGKTLFLTERADQAAPLTANAVGTRFTFSSVVYDQRGNRVGRDGADCVQTNTDGTFHCVISILFDTGDELTFQGLARGTDNWFAVTGGTGAYADAQGEARAVDVEPGHAELTVRLS